MKGNNSKYILDSLMVLLNLAAARGNILLFWIFGVTQLLYVLLIVIVFDIIYLFVRFKGFSFVGNIGASIHLFPLYLTFALLLVNYYNALREGSGFLINTTIILLVLLFAFIVGGLIKDYKNKLNNEEVAQAISKGYIWLSFLTIGGVFLSFFFNLLFDLHKTPIEADFLENNIEYGSSYYRSFFSVLIQDTDERVPFLQQFGVLTGLFHEPQVSTHNILPCLILMLGFAKSKRHRMLLFFSGILFILFSGSVTNMLVVSICFLVFFFVNSKHKLLGVSLGAGILVVLILIVLRFDTGGIMQDFIIDRLDSDNRSQLYSISMLIWSFSPRTLLGNNFLKTEYVLDIMNFGGAHSDVGLIPCALFIGYIITYFINTIRLLSIDNKLAKIVGIASLYFILHSTKIGMPMFIMTVPVLLIYLQYIVLNYYGRIKTHKKNL